jgi:hypothetical protein
VHRFEEIIAPESAICVACTIGGMCCAKDSPCPLVV